MGKIDTESQVISQEVAAFGHLFFPRLILVEGLKRVPGEDGVTAKGVGNCESSG